MYGTFRNMQPSPKNPDEAPGVIADRSRWGMALLHLQRSLAWNLARVPVAAREQRRLLDRGIAEPALQRYAVWRRSNLLIVTVPTLLSAVLSTVNLLAQGFDGLSRLGRGLNLISTLILYALPVSALAAAACWTNLRRSQRFTYIGWGLAFVPPILIALCPVRWWYAPGLFPEEQTGRRLELLVFDAATGLYFYLLLMPAVLSLLPGLIRACLRVKTLLPASIVPGWFLVAGAPFYLLLWLVALVAVNHLAGNLLLIAGVVLWVSAPMVYVFRAGLFVRPISDAESREIPRLQGLARAVAGVALLLLLSYLLTKQVFGLYLIGLDPETSLVWLWQNHEAMNLTQADILNRATALVWVGDLNLFDLAVEYLSRSMFMTAVFADVLLEINVSVWYHEKRFAPTEHALAYDRVMTTMSEAMRKDA